MLTSWRKFCDKGEKNCRKGIFKSNIQECRDSEDRKV